MKLQLTSDQVAAVQPLLARCKETPTPAVLAGQIVPGMWPEADKTWLSCAIISAATARKIRKLVEREFAQQKCNKTEDS